MYVVGVCFHWVSHFFLSVSQKRFGWLVECCWCVRLSVCLQQPHLWGVPCNNDSERDRGVGVHRTVRVKVVCVSVIVLRMGGHWDSHVRNEMHFSLSIRWLVMGVCVSYLS